jgi:hypothetical protein
MGRRCCRYPNTGSSAVLRSLSPAASATFFGYEYSPRRHAAQEAHPTHRSQHSDSGLLSSAKDRLFLAGKGWKIFTP